MILCAAIRISYNSVNANGDKLPGQQNSIIPRYLTAYLRFNDFERKDKEIRGIQNISEGK